VALLNACVSLVALEDDRQVEIRISLNSSHFNILWIIVLLTCTPNEGTLKMLGGYLTKCPHTMLSFGMP
jgi:hypothetical protein